jgi:ribosomal protein L12E/L44/L45/RPP1/RPP2
MKRDIQALATKYIDEVIKDQQELGYTDAVAAATREAAIEDAEAALGELAASTTESKKAVAA